MVLSAGRQKRERYISMSKFYVVGDAFGKSIARKLKVGYSKVEYRTFPDGEIQPRVIKERSGNVILAIRKEKKENIDDYLIRFFLLANKLKDRRRKVIAVMPYLPYARQDKEFRKGEPRSAEYIAELIEKNADYFITINMHEHRTNVKKLFKISAVNLSVFEDLGKEFRKFGLNRPIAIGPDYESEKFAREFAMGYGKGCEYSFFGKERNVRTGKIKTKAKKEIDLAGKDVIITDDVAATGLTLLNAAKIARKKRAKSISLCFVHGLLVNGAIGNIRKIRPKVVISSNTLDNKFRKLDVGLKIAEQIKSQKLFK